MKVGDKVKVLVGIEGVKGFIGKINSCGSDGKYRIQFNSCIGIHYQWFKEEEIELVEKN